MATAFANIAFTPSVKAVQQLYGSREAYSGFEHNNEMGLSRTEAEFIGARDSFYMASVSESGWPYVQHRGGAVGFIKVLSENTLGFADFRGNRQYVSVGNLNNDDRVALILMDYANKRRLKIWGHVRMIHDTDEPELLAQLEIPSYRARVERGMVITVAAFDWNCPQHITPRYSKTELEQLLAPLRAEIEVLKSQLAAVK